MLCRVTFFDRLIERVSTRVVVVAVEVVAHPDSNSKHWFTTSFLQPLPYLVTSQGPEKLVPKEQFFVGAQTEVNWLQTTQIISEVSFITDHVAYAS